MLAPGVEGEPFRKQKTLFYPAIEAHKKQGISCRPNILESICLLPQNQYEGRASYIRSIYLLLNRAPYYLFLSPYVSVTAHQCWKIQIWGSFQNSSNDCLQTLAYLS